MKNIYLPEQVKIINIEQMSPDVKLFRLKRTTSFFNAKKIFFIPGQFALVGLMGYGESPFGFASSP
ncbi:MAG: heterodisulfide reductase subunit F, partial [bacterium]|nr:heterodisulfide reductase subunit F [bacterium]